MRRLRDPLKERLSLAKAGAIAERGAKTTDHVVEPDTRFHQMAARGDHAADTVSGRGFDMHLLVETRSCQLRQPGGIVRIGLFRLHCLEALMRLPGIDADNWNTQIAKAKADRR